MSSIKQSVKFYKRANIKASVSNNNGVKNIALNLKAPRNTKIKVKKS